MSKRNTYEATTEKLVLPFIEEHSYELVDVEYVKEGSNWYLRVYLDKPNGITIDDCELVSRFLSQQLDEKDFIAEAYILEVSSPGLLRPMKKDKDFKRNIGKEIEVKCYKMIDHKKEFVGTLLNYDNECIDILIEEKKTKILRSDIALARLAIDFD